MADVWAAHDHKRKRDVAVKILRLPAAQSQEATRRLAREARVQEMIDHPNVATLYGGGLTPLAQPYLVVQLLRGRSLRDVIKAEKRVACLRAASYCWQGLQGLAATHEVGVHHRDLKPANMMLEPSPGPVERVVLIDFGFAALEGGPRLTAQGHVVGSLAYLSPERLSGEPGENSSDLYAIGVILYELLVGTRPFVAKSDADLMRMHLNEEPVPPRQAAPDANIPPAIEEVVLRALSKKPSWRASSARTMADELERATQTLR